MLRSNFPTQSIGRHVDHAAIKARAFTDQRIVVAGIDDPRLDSFERQFLQNVGEKLYGKKAAA